MLLLFCCYCVALVLSLCCVVVVLLCVFVFDLTSVRFFLILLFVCLFVWLFGVRGCCAGVIVCCAC